jgi:hypothetical protein
MKTEFISQGKQKASQALTHLTLYVAQPRFPQLCSDRSSSGNSLVCLVSTEGSSGPDVFLMRRSWILLYLAIYLPDREEMGRGMQIS